jgi:hypothetical protein
VIEGVIERWHAYLRGELPGGLDDLLDDDVVFYSPIVFTPQRGRQITSLYLQAAGQTFAGHHSRTSSEVADQAGRFHYTKTVLGGDTGSWSSRPRRRASTSTALTSSGVTMKDVLLNFG